MGLKTLVLGDALEGEAREMGVVMAGIARGVRTHGHPVAAPAVICRVGKLPLRSVKVLRGMGDAIPNSCCRSRLR